MSALCFIYFFFLNIVYLKWMGKVCLHSMTHWKKLLFFETIGHTISFVYYIQNDFNLFLCVYMHLLCTYNRLGHTRHIKCLLVCLVRAWDFLLFFFSISTRKEVSKYQCHSISQCHFEPKISTWMLASTRWSVNDDGNITGSMWATLQVFHV